MSRARTHALPAPEMPGSTPPGADPPRVGRQLPGSLDEAIAVMEESELVASTLGEHVFEFFLRNKRQEWHDYRSQITQYELERYLPML